MKRPKKLKTNGVIYTILVCATADLVIPAALEIACNLEQVKDKQVCAQNVQEPVRRVYSDAYSPNYYVTASGTASTSVSPSPSPAPDFS